VRIAAHHHLAGKGIVTEHLHVTDGFGPDPVGKLSVQPNPLFCREFALPIVQPVGRVEQARCLLLLADHLIQKREMIAEEVDAVRLVEFSILSGERLPEGGGHRGHVLVAEPDVRPDEPRVARSYRVYADVVGRQVRHPVRHSPAGRRTR